ncbi:ArsR/SmtB family transcription factor [Rhodococcus sp. 3Y1]
MDALAIFKALSTRLACRSWWARAPGEVFRRGLVYAAGSRVSHQVCVGDIQGRSGLAQSVISGYLQGMKDVGLLESERIGKWTYYRRNESVIGEFRNSFAKAVAAELPSSVGLFNQIYLHI